MSAKIGVLALQGGFAEHVSSVRQSGAEAFEIRQARDILHSFDGLILPGGESTVMGKLLCELDLMESLREMIQKGFPVFGTCAGLLLLAGRIAEGGRQGKTHLATMDITAVRNAYGRQLGSFNDTVEFKGVGKIPAVFIRAPYIETAGDGVKVLAECGGRVVAARQDNQLVTAFHPELTDSTAVHEYFLNMIH